MITKYLQDVSNKYLGHSKYKVSIKLSTKYLKCSEYPVSQMQ